MSLIIRTSLIWLRWSLILPVSVFFPILIDCLFRSVFVIGIDTRLVTIVARCIIMLLSTIGSLLLTYFIAPSNKFRASTTIAALWILVLAAGLIIVFGKLEIHGEKQTILDGGVSSVSMLIGLTIGLLTTRKLASRSGYAKSPLAERISLNKSHASGKTG